MHESQRTEEPSNSSEDPRWIPFLESQEGEEGESNRANDQTPTRREFTQRTHDVRQIYGEGESYQLQ